MLPETDSEDYKEQLPNDASGYEWKRETGDIQSFQHNQTGGWRHTVTCKVSSTTVMPSPFRRSMLWNTLGIWPLLSMKLPSSIRR